MAAQPVNTLEEQDKLCNKYCSGCRDNFYNDHNPFSIKRCWSLSSSVIVMRKKVGMNDVPPWNHKPIETLSCYRADGFVMVKSNKTY